MIGRAGEGGEWELPCGTFHPGPLAFGWGHAPGCMTMGWYHATVMRCAPNFAVRERLGVRRRDLECEPIAAGTGSMHRDSLHERRRHISIERTLMTMGWHTATGQQRRRRTSSRLAPGWHAGHDRTIERPMNGVSRAARRTDTRTVIAGQS